MVIFDFIHSFQYYKVGLKITPLSTKGREESEDIAGTGKQWE